MVCVPHLEFVRVSSSGDPVDAFWALCRRGDIALAIGLSVTGSVDLDYWRKMVPARILHSKVLFPPM